MKKIDILKRLYSEYTRKHLKQILLSLFFAMFVAGSTSAIAYLLDPAIEKIFIEKNQTLILLIPFAIIIAFTAKGVSLYFAKILMIKVGEEIKKDMQVNMLSSFIDADTQLIDSKHTGKYISNLNFDVMQITKMFSEAV